MGHVLKDADVGPALKRKKETWIQYNIINTTVETHMEYKKSFLSWLDLSESRKKVPDRQ